MTPAKRLGAELKRAMTSRQKTVASLAADIGFSENTIEHWRGGRSLATYEGALAAAEVLGWSSLRTIIIEARSRDCERCGRSFIAKQNINSMYCSRRCRQYKHVAKRNGKRAVKRHERNGRLLAVWEDVGDRMCRVWCPGGSEDNVCPDGSCPIQMAELCPWPVADGTLRRAA